MPVGSTVGIPDRASPIGWRNDAVMVSMAATADAALRVVASRFSLCTAQQEVMECPRLKDSILVDTEVIISKPDISFSFARLKHGLTSMAVRAGCKLIAALERAEVQLTYVDTYFTVGPPITSSSYLLIWVGTLNK